MIFNESHAPTFMYCMLNHFEMGGKGVKGARWCQIVSPLLEIDREGREFTGNYTVLHCNVICNEKRRGLNDFW
jgi:hypothetical protein